MNTVACPNCGATLSISVATSPAPPPVPAPVQPSPPGSQTPSLPPVVAGRAVMQTTLPWAALQRQTSPAPLDDSNVWLCRFVTGDAVPHDVRAAGAESGGGPLMRHAVLIRDRDGAVLYTVKGTSPTIWMTFNAAQTVSVFSPAKPVLDPHTAYTIAVWNDQGVGRMFMDLYS